MKCADANTRLKWYILDFLVKQELSNTATAMRSEGGMGEQQMPISHPKGAIFE